MREVEGEFYIEVRIRTRGLVGRDVCNPEVIGLDLVNYDREARTHKHRAVALPDEVLETLRSMLEDEARESLEEVEGDEEDEGRDYD